MRIDGTGQIRQLLDAVSQQVTRLLGDDRSLAMANDFVGRWLHTDQLMRVIRDSIIYKDLYFETRESMLKETEFLVDELWRGGRPFTELFTSEFSWLDERLAAYYDIDRGAGQPNDEGFVRVRVEETRPGGVLTQGSFLTTHASQPRHRPLCEASPSRSGYFASTSTHRPSSVVMPPPFDPNASTRENLPSIPRMQPAVVVTISSIPLDLALKGLTGLGVGERLMVVNQWIL